MLICLYYFLLWYNKLQVQIGEQKPPIYGETIDYESQTLNKKIQFLLCATQQWFGTSIMVCICICLKAYNNKPFMLLFLSNYILYNCNLEITYFWIGLLKNR